MTEDSLDRTLEPYSSSLDQIDPDGFSSSSASMLDVRPFII